MSNTSQQDQIWQVINRVKETPDSFTYVFSPATVSQKFTFTVGQFVTISAFLKRPTATGNLDEGIVQRTSSLGFPFKWFIVIFL